MRRGAARHGAAQRSQAGERAGEGEAGQGSHISALVRTRGPCRDEPGRKSLWLAAPCLNPLAYTLSCHLLSLPSSSLPSLHPFMYAYLPLSLFLPLFLPRLRCLLFLPFFRAYRCKLRQIFTPIFSGLFLSLYPSFTDVPIQIEVIYVYDRRSLRDVILITRFSLSRYIQTFAYS